jgi:hypothetical protein
MKLICRLIGHRLPAKVRVPCRMLLSCSRCRERFLAGE